MSDERSRSVVRVLLMVGCVVGAGCGDDPTGPSFRPERIVIDSGDGQSAAAGAVLPLPVVAHAERADGTAVGAILFVRLTAGDGSIDIGGARGSGTGITLSNGAVENVSVAWTLGSAPGPQRIRIFALRSLGDTVSVSVTATALAASGSR